MKLRLDRDDDFLVTGRRHCFHYEYEVGFDDDGRILGAELTMVSRAGFSADLSGPVMTRAVCHFDNTYWLPDVAIHGYSGRDQHAEQHRISRLRRAAGRDRDREHPRLDRQKARQGSARRAQDQLLRPEPASGRARRAQRHAVRPGRRGQHHRTSSSTSSRRRARYRARRAEIAEFNAKSAILKRGIALTPVKFGISFNLVHLNQAGALVHVYGDGSVLVNHGGTEMGQGLNTKVAQVVAHDAGQSTSTRCASPRPTRTRSRTPRRPRHRPAAT